MRKQCKACPWKVSTVPDRDIPDGYCAARHRTLKTSIAEPGALPGLRAPLRVMACHEFPVGAEQECVGWVHHQLGLGGNIALRLRALDGRYNGFQIVGEQHETFEATLGTKEDQ